MDRGSSGNNSADISSNPLVYVDAKIIVMHDKQLQRNAFVGYIVKGTERELSGVRPVAASETDEAEEQAILFAITELKGRIPRFTIICDHESAVTKVNWKGDERRKAKKDRVLPSIWKELDEAKSIEVKALGTNPAHSFLNRSLREKGLEG